MKASIEVQNKVIFRRFSGKVCIDDMIQSWKEIFTRYEDLTSYKGILTSFLEAEIQSGDNNLNIMVEYLKEYLDRIRGLKVAIVMDTPKVTNTIIMNQKMKNMHIRPFSSEAAALEWIDS
jgi:hypothetical protein